MQGYQNLVVLDKHQANLDILRQCHPDIIAEYADLAEIGEWEEHFDGTNVVVMLQVQIGGSNLEPFIRNNIASTDHILNAIKYYQVPYTVHISSSVVESIANDHYTHTKKEQEQRVLNSDVECVVLRPTLMFGWFDRKRLGWLSRFMQKTPVFPIPGDSRYMRQPLYAEDFAQIIMSCIEHRIKGRIFNINGLEKIDYIAMIQRIKRVTRAKTRIVKIPYFLFYQLLKIWAWVDWNPPFTANQLKALVAHDEFEVIDWPSIFNVKPTPFDKAIEQTFNDPTYSPIVLKF